LNIHLLLWERSPDRDYPRLNRGVQEHSPTWCSIILCTYIEIMGMKAPKTSLLPETLMFSEFQVVFSFML